MLIKDSLVVTEHSVGAVLLDKETGNYYRLNLTGLLVYRGVASGKTSMEIALDLQVMCADRSDQIREDVDRLIEEFTAAGFVVEQ